MHCLNWLCREAKEAGQVVRARRGGNKGAPGGSVDVRLKRIGKAAQGLQIR